MDTFDNDEDRIPKIQSPGGNAASKLKPLIIARSHDQVLLIPGVFLSISFYLHKQKELAFFTVHWGNSLRQWLQMINERDLDYLGAY